IHPEMERPAILNRSMPAIAGATIRVLPARTIDEAFQRAMPSRGTEVIYIFERRDTRGGAIFPGTDVLVLMLYTDCSFLSLKSAHFSRLLPRPSVSGNWAECSTESASIIECWVQGSIMHHDRFPDELVLRVHWTVEMEIDAMGGTSSCLRR